MIIFVFIRMLCDGSPCSLFSVDIRSFDAPAGPVMHDQPKQRTGARLAPNTRYRPSSHPNEKRPSHYGRGAQSADKAYNRKNCPDKREIGCNFCFLQVDLPSPSGSSNPVARLQAQGLASRRWRPFLTIKDRQKRLGDKFCRRQNFLVSCTCILRSLTSK